MDNNKQFVVSFVLQELGKDIQTEASRKFVVGQRVTTEQLENFSADYGLVTEIGTAQGLNKQRITLKNHLGRVHLMGLEIND